MVTTAYGFKPWGLRGFCLGSVGSYGTFAGGVGDQRAVTWREGGESERSHPSSEIRWDRT